MSVTSSCTSPVIFRSSSICRNALPPKIQTKYCSWKNFNFVATNTRLCCSHSDLQLPISSPKEVATLQICRGIFLFYFFSERHTYKLAKLYRPHTCHTVVRTRTHNEFVGKHSQSHRYCRPKAHFCPTYI